MHVVNYYTIMIKMLCIIIIIVDIGPWDTTCLSCDHNLNKKNESSYSFARKGSEEKTLKMESLSSGKHPWTTLTPESHLCAITRPTSDRCT